MKCQKKSEKCPSEVPRVQEVMSSNCTNSSKPKDINLAQVNETKQNKQTNKQKTEQLQILIFGTEMFDIFH